MSLGSSASFRRIVSSRDTSTTESEIPSFRDAKPWQSTPAARHCEQGPMSLGSSASFRRIVSSRDTSTTESEIPSFRDTKPHESWELVPLDELCKAEAILAGTSSLRAKRSNLVNRKKDCHTPLGFAMTTVACTFCSHFHVKTGQKFPSRAIFI